MHGHALSGSRKLNRHWQSGSSFKLEENLVFFEREIDVTEWKDEPGDIIPYWKYFKGGTLDKGKWIHEDYKKKNPERDIKGFKQLVFTQPGDYKVHWNIETHEVENFIREGKNWNKIGTGNFNQNFGMFGVNMFPRVDYIQLRPGEVDRYRLQNGLEYYTGGCDSYIAWHPSGVWGDELLFESDISFLVIPSRKSTTTKHGYNDNYDGAYTFNLSSKTKEQVPEVILHVGDKAPFEEYTVKVQRNPETREREIVFEHEGFYYAPLIDFLFADNIPGPSITSCIITGKIWLERIGDYTDLYEGWEPKAL